MGLAQREPTRFHPRTEKIPETNYFLYWPPPSSFLPFFLAPSLSPLFIRCLLLFDELIQHTLLLILVETPFFTLAVEIDVKDRASVVTTALPTWIAADGQTNWDELGATKTWKWNQMEKAKGLGWNGRDKIQDGEADFESIRAGKDFGYSSTLLQALSLLCAAVPSFPAH